jgi:ribosomal protein S18 acetylase RimI-like enzyme
MVLGNDIRKGLVADAVRAGRCLAAWTGDTLAGFGILEQTFYRQGFIGLLIVHPDYRRRGVVTALIHRIESICPTEKLFTSTNESNVIAQKTYEALGFIRSGYIENLDENDPEIIYFKRLSKGGE